MSTLIQVLYILGAIGLAIGVIALKPDPATGLVLAAAALGFAAFVQFGKYEDLSMLGTAMAIAGTLGLCGSLSFQLQDTLPAIAINLMNTFIVTGAAVIFESLFLVAFVPIGLAAVIGSETAYWHAAYAIFVREAALTIVLFGGLAVLLFRAAERFSGIRAQQANIAGRVSWIIMNFGFWVGSLWGDYIGEHLFVGGDGWNQDYEALAKWRETAIHVDEFTFIVAWAAVSLTTIFYLRRNRFAVNASITFLGINAYTQFFGLFAGSGIALITGGATLLLFAFGLFRFDRWSTAQRNAQANAKDAAIQA